MGSGDAYTYAYDQIQNKLSEHKEDGHLIRNKEKEKMWRRCIDDMLSWTGDIWDSFRQMWMTLSHCGKNDVVFNPRKTQFAEVEVEAFGFKVGQQGINS